MTATSAIATAAIPTAALPRHDIAVARRADAAHQRAGDRMDHDRLHRSDAVHVAKIELVPLGGEAALDRLGQHVWREERSEEHTSELQSPYDLVCRLLLEKKKKKID